MIDYLKKIILVSKYTFRDLLKSKILINVVILAIFLSIITYVAYSFTFAVPERVALDVGLGVVTLSTIMIAIFMGVGLISYEIESRTLYMVLSRPLPRISFLLGKIFGMASFLFLNLLILSSIVLFLYFILGGKYQPLILHVLSFIYIESIIVLSMVIFFSLVTNRPLAVLFTLFIYIFGFAVGTAQEMLFVKNNLLLKSVLEIYTWIFPILTKINYKDHLLYSVEIPFIQITYSYLYGIFYFLLVSMASSFIFKNKNLD